MVGNLALLASREGSLFQLPMTSWLSAVKATPARRSSDLIRTTCHSRTPSPWDTKTRWCPLNRVNSPPFAVGWLPEKRIVLCAGESHKDPTGTETTSQRKGVEIKDFLITLGSPGSLKSPPAQLTFFIPSKTTSDSPMKPSLGCPKSCFLVLRLTY